MKYLVAGAESAVGLALIRILADGGHHVLALASTPSDELNAASEATPGSLDIVVADLGDIEQLVRSARDFAGPFDGLVFAHMYFEMENRARFDLAHWQRSFGENLVAPAALSSTVSLSDNASIVVLTSTEAFQGSYRGGAYAASKAAAHNLVMTLANNLGARGIRANAVAAGWIGGVMDTDTVFEMSRGITPLGRLGSPAEVANVIQFLLSADSSFVSGSVITVDGGYTGVDPISRYEADHTPED